MMTTDDVRYVVGTNVPGYMPDDEPWEADDLGAARRALVAELWHDADAAGDRGDDDLFEALALAAEDVNLWSGPDSVTVADRAYWIALAEGDVR